MGGWLVGGWLVGATVGVGGCQWWLMGISALMAIMIRMIGITKVMNKVCYCSTSLRCLLTVEDWYFLQ